MPKYSGGLTFQAIDKDSFTPIKNVNIKVYKDTDDITIASPLYTLSTDDSGQTSTLELDAPNLEFSQNPSTELPYSKYTLRITSETFLPLIVEGVQIYPGAEAIQPLRLSSIPAKSASSFPDQAAPTIINVKSNTLTGGYPPKIPEAVDKVEPPPTGLVVLDRPVVPQYIIVHDGVPDDPSAPNYYEPFRDYIKNVASSEIFATWPEETIRANVLCILSFTLNRVFTEWYRGKGKNFTITSSTAYDHAYSRGRNLYKNISQIVDEIFTNFVKRPDRRQPLLTQYCDGKNVSCPGWMTQWGSKYLGDKKYTAIEILKHFYGGNIQLTAAEKVLGVPSSYPGYDLKKGSTGTPVKQIQRMLNRISDNFPAIPKSKVDGVFGNETDAAVRKFQSLFYMPVSGIVDYPTWYKISDIYVGVTNIAELNPTFAQF